MELICSKLSGLVILWGAFTYTESQTCDGDVCISFSSEYIQVGDTDFYVQCQTPGRTGMKYISLSPPWNGAFCSSDCEFIQYDDTYKCWNYTDIQYCKCDDTQHESPNPGTICAAGTKVVEVAITSVREVHIGEWECRYDGLTANDTVKKLDGLTSADISGPTTVEAGRVEEYLCSADGNPASDITWLLNDAEIPSANSSYVTPVGEATRTSKLTYHPVKEHNGQNIYCKANQAGRTEKQSQSLTLNVQYKPEVQLKVNGHVRTADYIVLEKSELKLVCETQPANPETTDYIFYVDTTIIRQKDPSDSHTIAQVTDQGEYKCTGVNSVGEGGTSGANVLIHVKAEIINFTPREEASIGEDITVMCEARGNPTPTFKWTPSGDDNGSDQTMLLSDVEKSDNGSYVCEVENTVSPTDGSDEPVTDSATLNVFIRFPPEVEIGPCADRNVNVAEKGDPLTLECHVTDAYPQTQSYVWKKEDVVKPGATGPSHKVSDSVQPDDEGKYSCQGVNGEEGALADSLPLEVQFHPENTVINSTTGPVEVLENSTVYLWCDSDANPAASYTWTSPDGMEASDNSILEIPDIQYTKVGLYGCEADNSIKTCNDAEPRPGTDTTGVEVLVLHNPKGTPGNGPGDAAISVETDLSLTCHLGELLSMGWPYASHVIWMLESGGERKNTTIQTPGEEVDAVEWVFNSQSVKDTGKYSCMAENRYGFSYESEGQKITVEAPATIESNDANTETPNYNCDNPDVLTITCDVSASNLDSLYITHNGTRVSQSPDYDVSEIGPISGDYSYGLDEAHRITMNWRAAEKDEICQNTVFYDGVYKCHASATSAGSINNVVKVSANIVTHYSPIAREEKNYTVQLGQTNITLPCNICAIPEPLFQWYFEGIIIEGATEQMYILDIVTNTSFGAYTCHVNNSAGSNNIIMHLLQSGIPGKPEDIHVISDSSTSSSVTVAWTSGRDGNHPPLEHTIEVRPLSTEGICNDTINYSYYATIESTQLTYNEYVIETLEPDTTYDLRVVANNQRGNKVNTSEYVYVCNASTIDSPDIGPFNTELQEDRIIVTWDSTPNTLFGSIAYLGLQFHYNVQGSDIHENIHPSANETIDANMISYTIIFGDFNLEKDYWLEIYMFEGNNKQGSIAPNQPSAITADKTATSSVGLICVTAILSLLFLLSLVAFVTLLLRGVIAVDLSKLRTDSSANSQYRENEMTYENEGFTGKAAGPKAKKERIKVPDSHGDVSYDNTELRSVGTVEYREVDLQTVNSMQNQNPQENRKTEMAEYQDIDLNHIEPKVEQRRTTRKCQPKIINNSAVTDYEDVNNKGETVEATEGTPTYEPLSAQYQNLPVVNREEPKYQELTQPLNPDHFA